MLKDKLSHGITIGLILPLIALWISFLAKYGSVNPMNLINLFFKFGILSQLWSICLIANLGGFFLAYNKKWDQMAKGIIFSTIIYALLGVVLYYWFGKPEWLR